MFVKLLYLTMVRTGTKMSAYPNLVTIFMSLKSTLLSIAGSMILVTESTQIGAKRFEYCDTT